MNLALAQRIGVSAPPTLPRKVANILKKFGSDAHLYLFGPGVPILGPELVTNGDGASVAGWVAANAVASIQSGEICNTGTGPLYPEVLQDFSTTVGKEYRVTGTSRRGTSANPAWVLAKRKLGGGNLTSSTANSSQVSAPFSFNFVAQDDQSRISLVQSSGTADAGTVLFDNISVREILGYSNTYSGFVAGNYFDSAGTTHASVDGSVGAVLDAAGSVGAELVTNGDFSSDTWWRKDVGVTIGSGACSFSAVANGFGVWRPAALQLTKKYRVSYQVTAISGGALRVNCGTATGVARSAVGEYSEHIDCAGGTAFAIVASGTTTAVIDNVSVREVTGIHASQSTPGYKPTLRKGIVNLLTWSNDLTNAVWAKRGTAVVTPNYSQGLARISGIDDSAVGDVYQLQISGYPSGNAYTPALVLAKDPACPSGILRIANPQNGNSGMWYVDISMLSLSAEVITKGHPAVSVVNEFVGNTNAGGVHVLKHSGVGTLSVLVGNVGAFQGTLTAAQILAAGGIPLTTTAPASSVAGVNYLEFKAANSTVLQLPSPAFQMADDHFVVASANFYGGGPALNKVIYSPSADSTPGSIKRLGQIAYDLGSARIQGSWYDGTNYDELYFAWPVGVPFVAATRKVGSVLELWVNGVLRMTKTATATAFTANCGSIGAYPTSGAASYFDGAVYYADAIKGTVSNADLVLQCKLAAQSAGIQL